MKTTPTFFPVGLTVLTGLMLVGGMDRASARPNGENLPPRIRLLSPSEGQVIDGALAYTSFAVDARDVDGKVVSVEYFNGTNSLGIVSNEPPYLFSPDGSYVLSWVTGPGFGFSNALPAGEYEVRAKATDDRGATAISDRVRFTVTGPPAINIVATDPYAAEPGTSSVPDPGIFTITRTGDVVGDLPVNFYIRGSAESGVDFVAISNSVVIPAGQDSVRIEIDPLNDSVPDGRKTVTINLLFHSTPIPYSVVSYPTPLPPYFVGAHADATVFIADADGGPTNQVPTVNIVSPQDGQVIVESAILHSLGVQANDPDGNIVRVEFFVNGHSVGVTTNKLGILSFPGYPYPYPIFWNAPWTGVLTDEGIHPAFLPPGPSIVFPFANFQLPWNPKPGEYTVTAKATDNDGASTISNPAQVTVVPATIVTVRATDPIAAEPDGAGITNQGTFTITRSGSTNGDLSVYFTLAGTAGDQTDYTIFPDHSVTPGLYDYEPGIFGNVRVVQIPTGQYSTQIVVDPGDDPLPERIESVCLNLAAPPFPLFVPAMIGYIWTPPYQVGKPSKATVFITDNDRRRRNHPPRVKIIQPQNGQAFSAAGSITISADTVDAESFVNKVEFFDGRWKIGAVQRLTDFTPAPGSHVPFQFVWTNAPFGRHILSARATDTQGASQVSPPVRIWVAPANSNWPIGNNEGRR